MLKSHSVVIKDDPWPSQGRSGSYDLLPKEDDIYVPFINERTHLGVMIDKPESKEQPGSRYSQRLRLRPKMHRTRLSKGRLASQGF